MAINKRERKLLIITIAIVVVGLNYFVVMPLWGRWHDLGKKLMTQQRELAGMNRTIVNQAAWQNSLDELGHNLKKGEQFEAVSTVLKKIDDLATTSGVLMQSRRSREKVEQDVYRVWPVQCNFESTTESLVKFLYGLQTGSGFMSVEQLNITAKPDNSSILRCDIQIHALAAKPAS